MGLDCLPFALWISFGHWPLFKKEPQGGADCPLLDVDLCMVGRACVPFSAANQDINVRIETCISLSGHWNNSDHEKYKQSFYTYHMPFCGKCSFIFSIACGK